MGCPSCGAEDSSGARFCNDCGTYQAAVCPGCGSANLPASRFCKACSQALTAPAPASEATPRLTPGAPVDYTPRHLADKIPAGRPAFQGERKQVTVLFADVVGSTELVRDRDPEDAQRPFDGALQRMMRAVHRYEGTVRPLCAQLARFAEPRRSIHSLGARLVPLGVR